jgi:staphylococcal nuclease domain-containing protein 1
MSERETVSASRCRSSTLKVCFTVYHAYTLVNTHLLLGILSLEKLMHEFSLHHKSATIPAGFAPKGGDLVSAKFSDGSWYRAKIRRVSPVKREAEVTFIDYGNQDTIGFKDIRPLEQKFRALPGQAYDARLRYVNSFM